MSAGQCGGCDFSCHTPLLLAHEAAIHGKELDGKADSFGSQPAVRVVPQEHVQSWFEAYVVAGNG